MTFTGTITDINNALDGLSYQGTLNFNGTDSLSITTNDLGNTGTPGALQDSDSVGITVNAVNDAPSNSVPGTQTTNEDTAVTFNSANSNLVSVSDVDAGAGNVTTTLTATDGTVTLSGTAGLSFAAGDGTNDTTMTFSGTIANVDNALNGMAFTPSANFNGSGANLQIVTNDNGNTGSGGAQSDTDNVPITVTAVNDAPQNSVPGAQSVNEDTSLVFNSAHSNLISTSDVDAGASSVKVTFSALHGGLTLSTTAGLNFGCVGCAGSGNGDATMTFTGTLSAVNTALNGASYLGTLNYNGPDTITLTVNDQGATGSGGAQSDTDTIGVTVNPVNDAPAPANQTFTGTSKAIGNTTFVSRNTTATANNPADGAPATPDPTDTSPATDRPHKTVTGDVMSGTTDVDSPASGFTVTGAGTDGTNGNTTDGGKVSIQSDGDFIYEPTPTSCSDPNHQDSFLYTVSDNDPTSPGAQSATATVTIDLTGCAWYVDNNDAQGNSGTSEKPFDALAQAEAASSTGDSIFVYHGDGSSTGQTSGIDLKANQSLIGEAGTLTVGSDTLNTADSTKRPLITDTTSNVVNLAAGNTLQGLQLDPQGGGGISGGSGDASGTIDNVKVIDTGTPGTAPGLDLSSTSGTYNVSNLTVDTSGATSPTSADIGVRVSSAGTVNFASSGTISIKTKGALGLDATSTNMGADSVFDDITVTGSGTGGVNMSSTTGTTSLGDGSGTDLDLTTSSGTAAALSLINAGTVSVPGSGTANLSATGGPAADIQNTTSPHSPSQLGFDMDSVSSTNSSTDGVNLDGLGTSPSSTFFTATGGSISGAAGIAFDLNGGDGTVTYPGDLNNGTGSAAEITNRSGGTVGFSGNINDSIDAGGGISESGNSAGSVTFSGTTKTLDTGASDAVAITFPNASTGTATFSNGGLNIHTTSANGFTANGVDGNDGNVQVSGSSNTIDSTALTSGASLTPLTRALNIVNANINASGVTFQRVSAAGSPANGIRLNNTGSAGEFKVAGNGTANSGGTITSAAGAGIDLTSVGAGVELNRVNVTSGADDGIRANGVSGSTVGLTLDDSSVTSNGNAAAENGLDWTSVTGPSAIRNTTVSGSADFNAILNNSSGTLNLTVTGDTFSGSGTDDGLQVNGDGAAVIRSKIDSNTFSNNHGDAIQISNVDGTGDTSQQDTTITTNTITGSASTSLDGGIKVDHADGEQLKANVSNNSINNTSVSALILNPGPSGTASSTYDATASGNTIGTTGVADSGSVDGDGLQVKSASDGDARLAVTNNIIKDYDKNGMMLRASESNQSGHSTQLTATGNQNLRARPEPLGDRDPGRGRFVLLRRAHVVHGRRWLGRAREHVQWHAVAADHRQLLALAALHQRSPAGAGLLADRHTRRAPGVLPRPQHGLRRGPRAIRRGRQQGHADPRRRLHAAHRADAAYGRPVMAWSHKRRFDLDVLRLSDEDRMSVMVEPVFLSNS